MTTADMVAEILHDTFKGDTDVDLDRLAVIIADRLDLQASTVQRAIYARSGRGSKPPPPGGRPPGSR